jgi:polyisoprenoid-binding protein YceI
VGFEIGYSVGTHDGWTREIDGRVVYSADPFVISEAEFNVPAPALTTGKIALRDKHMHEVLESDKFQLISFVLSKPMGSDTVAKMNPGDEVKVSATGVWTMHGVSRELTLPMKVKLLKDAGNPLLIRAKFDLNNADFGIKPYTYLGLTTEDTSTITLSLPLRTQ